MGEILIGDVHVTEGRGEVVKYIKENHYSGTCGPIGNYYKLIKSDTNEIVGGIAFTNPMSEKVREFISENKKEVTELHRLYTDEMCGKNMETWFISQALDRLKKKKPKYRFVVSYADETEGHTGIIYKASNALYTGTASSRKFYRDDDGNLRSPRQGGKNITLEKAKEKGWEIEERDIKHRYVFPLPDKYESRSDVIEDMKCETEPYP